MPCIFMVGFIHIDVEYFKKDIIGKYADSRPWVYLAIELRFEIWSREKQRLRSDKVRTFRNRPSRLVAAQVTWTYSSELMVEVGNRPGEWEDTAS